MDRGCAPLFRWGPAEKLTQPVTAFAALPDLFWNDLATLR